MDGIIKEPSNSDHNRRSYIVTFTKTGRLVIQKTIHIGHTPITTGQYLWEQIKKGTGQLEGIFMKTMPVEQDAIIFSRLTDTDITYQ